MDPVKWLHLVCDQLGKEWTDLPAVRAMSKNHQLYGAYVEGSVRRFVRRFVAPLQVSTGTIVYEDNFGETSPQLDAIIWHPSPLPPIVEVGDFAMIPRMAGLAYLEIKASNYGKIADSRWVGEQIAEKLALVDVLVPKVEGLPAELQDTERALGVICVHDAKKKEDKVLERLISESSVAVMVRKDGDTLKVDSSGIVRLAKFLTHTRLRAKMFDGLFAVRDPNELAKALEQVKGT